MRLPPLHPGAPPSLAAAHPLRLPVGGARSRAKRSREATNTAIGRALRGVPCTCGLLQRLQRAERRRVAVHRALTAATPLLPALAKEGIEELAAEYVSLSLAWMHTVPALARECLGRAAPLAPAGSVLEARVESTLGLYFLGRQQPEIAVRHLVDAVAMVDAAAPHARGERTRPPRDRRVTAA